MGLVGLVVVFVFNSIKNLHNPIFLWGKKRKKTSPASWRKLVIKGGMTRRLSLRKEEREREVEQVRADEQIKALLRTDRQP